MNILDTWRVSALLKRLSARLRGALVSALAVRVLPWAQTDQADEADLYFCYRLLLGRAPDPQGWQHWRLALAQGWTSAQVARGFLESAEFQRGRTRAQVQRVALDDFAICVDLSEPTTSLHIYAS